MSGTSKNVTYTYMLSCPVFLIGFMGAGKTTTGRFLGMMYGIPHVDSDTYIEEQAHTSIANIFATKGEEFFRQKESACLSFLSKLDPPAIVSCGGGIVVRKKNIQLMREAGVVVWLTENANDARRRIPNASTRPLFKSSNASEKKASEDNKSENTQEASRGKQNSLVPDSDVSSTDSRGTCQADPSPEQLLKQRIPLYTQAAHIQISTTNKVPFEVAQQVGEALKNANVLQIRKLM